MAIVAGRLRAGRGRGHRPRHPARGAGQDLRAVLHHQGGRQGHRPRPVDGLRHRQADRRLRVLRERAGRRRDVSHSSAPRAIGDEAEEPVKKEAAKPAADLTGRGAILLVEDEEAVRAFASRALASRGYTVLEAETGVDALQRRRGGGRADRPHRLGRHHAGNGRADDADRAAPARIDRQGRSSSPAMPTTPSRATCRKARNSSSCPSRSRSSSSSRPSRARWLDERGAPLHVRPSSPGSRMSMRFEGTNTYVAGDELKTAVNAAIALERPLLVKGEPGTGKTLLAQEIAGAHRRAVHRLARQVDDPRAAGPLRIRRRLAPARFAARRPARLRHRQLHPARQAVGGLRLARSPGAADRRDRQGRHRIPQRSPARTRPDGVPRLRDRRDGQGAPAADRHHHLQQREGAARRIPAPLLLSLHPLSRHRDDARDRRIALSRRSSRGWSRRRCARSSRCARRRA